MRMCRGRDDARQRQRAKLGVEPDDFIFAFLGYIYPAKSVETLLKAFQIVMRQKSQVKLLLSEESSISSEKIQPGFRRLRLLC